MIFSLFDKIHILIFSFLFSPSVVKYKHILFKKEVE